MPEFPDHPVAEVVHVPGVGNVEPAAMQRAAAGVDSPDDIAALHKGGGWYELPSGEKIQGADEAREALGLMEEPEASHDHLVFAPDEDEEDGS